jgi:hypothetical protein
MRQCGCCVVVSRLALRWAAQQPHWHPQGLSGKPQCLVLGPLRSPTQGKPARHKKPAHHERLVPHTKPIQYKKLVPHGESPHHGLLALLWQSGCCVVVSRLATRSLLTTRGLFPTRSLFNTRSLFLHVEPPHHGLLALLWPSGWCVVVSRLVLRWAAQQPHWQPQGLSGKPQCLVLGPLRGPTQGKPAHHKKPAHHTRLVHHMKPTHHSLLALMR